MVAVSLRDPKEDQVVKAVLDPQRSALGAWRERGSTTDPRRKPQRGTAALRPVTIHQIATAVQPHPDAEFQISDKDVKDVSASGPRSRWEGGSGERRRLLPGDGRVQQRPLG